MEKKMSSPAASPAPVKLKARELELVIAPQGIITNSRLPLAPLPAGIIKT
jgi:hypothetical protein